MDSTIILVIFLAAGLLSIAGGAMDWDWFMERPRSRMFVSLFGRQGARYFFIALGTVVCVLGVVIYMTK